jgi:hypothetical protein
MILVLYSHLVQLFEVDAQYHCPIFLIHEQDWGTPVVGKNTLQIIKLGSDLHADFDHKEITF